MKPLFHGPALTRRPLPVAALTLSAIGHALVLGGMTAALIWSGWTSEKTYVVNLVPAVAAVGSPTGISQPSLPPRPAAVQTPRSTLPEPEPREARSREPLTLPESAPPMPRLASRPATLPRAGEKELPPLSSPSDRRTAPAPAARAAETPTEARPAGAPVLGQATGSPAGAGALSLDVSDFPHAWYLRQVLQKVEERWQRQGQASDPPQKPLVLVEIQRDGSIRPPRIEKSSGNAFYDQAALRAITDASPFPPLPTDWTRASLRVMFRFDLRNGRG